MRTVSRQIQGALLSLARDRTRNLLGNKLTWGRVYNVVKLGVQFPSLAPTLTDAIQVNHRLLKAVRIFFKPQDIGKDVRKIVRSWVYHFVWIQVKTAVSGRIDQQVAFWIDDTLDP
jgi:hypothetical protein